MDARRWWRMAQWPPCGSGPHQGISVVDCTSSRGGEQRFRSPLCMKASLLHLRSAWGNYLCLKNRIPQSNLKRSSTLVSLSVQRSSILTILYRAPFVLDDPYEEHGGRLALVSSSAGTHHRMLSACENRWFP